MLNAKERLKGLREEIVQLSAEHSRDVKRGKKSVRTLENELRQERRQDRLYEIMEELRSLTERRRA